MGTGQDLRPTGPGVFGTVVSVDGTAGRRHRAQFRACRRLDDRRRGAAGLDWFDIADDDRAIVAVLFQGGLRRSEAAALRWADVQDAADGRGIVVCVRRSKTDQDGTAADVRYVKNGCAAALRQLRDRLTVQRSGLRPDGDRARCSAASTASP